MLHRFVLSLLVLAAMSGTHCMIDASAQSDGLEPAFEHLSFTRPLDLQDPGDGTNRLFVVEQAGRIFVFENDPAVRDTELFLDIRERVNDEGNEEGLLGLAFHPSYAENGYFYVNYTALSPRRTVIARYAVDPSDPSRADPESEHVLLEYDQPYGNHNGGQVSFGPDGYLYIGVGDGGNRADPHNHGQNRGTLLGSILRIDVDQTDGDRAYGIPPDNPFAGNNEGYREEIFAYGLRNPWRFSFDAVRDALWVGDVGQNAYEEVALVRAGENHGWNIMEATHCFNATTCDRSGLTLPVWEYGREEGVSITGGYVYEGTRLPALQGWYVVADYATGKIWGLRVSESEAAAETEAVELADTELNISSFAVDRTSELYVLAFDGKIYRPHESITQALPASP